MTYALTHIKKFADVFNYIYNISKHNEDHIRKFVETEYPPKDREWAYILSLIHISEPTRRS